MTCQGAIRGPHGQAEGPNLCRALTSRCDEITNCRDVSCRPMKVFVRSSVAALPVLAASTSAQRAPADVEWRAYGGDLKHQHYSPLAQITAQNFNSLEVAWRFKTDSLGPRPEFKLEGTPLEVNGILYTTAGTRRAAVALDAATGELRWVHAEYEGARAAASPRQLSGRGVAYWTDGRDERILYVTTGYRLVALDAKTGVRIPAFGTDGIVDLKEGAVFGKGQQ